MKMGKAVKFEDLSDKNKGAVLIVNQFNNCLEKKLIEVAVTNYTASGKYGLVMYFEGLDKKEWVVEFEGIPEFKIKEWDKLF